MHDDRLGFCGVSAFGMTRLVRFAKPRAATVKVFRQPF
jgi:hypothetical protein